MKPPLPPLGALASSVPSTFVVPAAMPPSKTMVPAWFSTVRASITPVLLTTLASNASCAPALINTRPPLARITPPLALWLSSTLWSIFILTKLLSLNVKVTALPAPNATVPFGALMLPWLLTLLPSKATKPPVTLEPEALMLPKLATLPMPRPLKLRLLLSKLVSLKSKDEATKAPTLICAPWPNKTPLGLIKYTCPFALRRPMI